MGFVMHRSPAPSRLPLSLYLDVLQTMELSVAPAVEAYRQDFASA
jgi:hypothetical protein